MKNVIVTGAAGNLGKAVTEAFLQGDYFLNVFVLDKQEDTEKIKAYYPDLTRSEQVEAAVAEVIQERGPVDVVINLVGGYKPGGMAEMTKSDVDEMMAINFNTALNVSRAVIPGLRESGGGKLIFIGAKAAMNPNTAAYNVAYAWSKQLVVSLAGQINAEYANDHIEAYVLLPGTLDTPLNRKFMPDADFSQWVPTPKLAATMVGIAEGREAERSITF